ncbi:hypothetical protein NJBCHELONAE_14910 [Mycobacteroides chelonae]|uniref:hypothetical protein n=1 Tax=Mycobacteroides chelonae TaxID=1774 RepID=UPI0021DBA901|nr:hypothetical protein [Mycobacteroides chelonae]GLE56183.1 hypothetical protein NJBCHELONAE_14910 [Mycobacteroides chelonae]
MALISAAVCPHPVMLIPDIAGEVEGDWRRLRDACLETVRRLNIPIFGGGHVIAENAPHLVVIVGGDDTTRSFDPACAYGSLWSNGIRWDYGWGVESEDPQPLPLSLTLGYWLMSKSRIGETGIIVADVAFQAIDYHASPQACTELGRDLARRAERVAMIVMGEGSTCMTAADWARDAQRGKLSDGQVLQALSEADADALARIDFQENATGRAAWQVLAGAAGDQRFHGYLHATGSRRDNRYFAASWTLQS